MQIKSYILLFVLFLSQFNPLLAKDLFLLSQDIRDGVNTKYYENGKVQGEYNYKDGAQNGLTTLYYESGQVRGEYILKNQMYDGWQTEYKKDGSIRETSCYKDNLVVDNDSYCKNQK